LPTIPLAEKKTVLEILGSFKGTGPLRELLAQLNYDPLNEPVSRNDWPEPAKVALAQDPRIYGQAAGDFYVIYAQLAADKLKLTDERTVIPQLLKEYPYALFVFSDKSQTEFHFVNVKWENNQKRRLYRRIAVGPQERLRTAVERISLLDIQTIEGGLFGITAQQIQDRHDEAFDVAKVSKSFFDEYKRVFEVMRDAVKGFGPSEEEQDRRHLFTQRLFNRLMFLRFIQKKGWLTIDGSTDYLAALWASHGKLKQDGKNFYTDRLRLLFAALNNERAGIVLQGGGGTVEATIGKVKYLNGGLFEETDEDKDPKIRIADAPFKEVFNKANGLFEAFNFTITESTPLDIEIAVDPEMLGKIFEELVTGRHDSGSYYTPKPIVSFMCREALKGYLETQAPDEQKAAIERFVDRHEPDEIRNAEAVLNALRRVTVCDPACGSGAYLLGMMHELLDLRQCLFQTRQVDNKTMYQRKLDIIQTNIYGVDLAEFAVNIARLRLWLSLAVDFDGPAPEPLPNLDYKIEIGDSICSPSPSALQMGIQQALVNDFLIVKKKYLIAHHADKQTLRSQVEALRLEIISFSNRDADGFDWVIDFAEVFVDGGFDIVIANPPYVRMELFKAIKPILRKNFTQVHSDRADLYCYFYARGQELLRVDGMLSFISPNKWLRAKYGAPLRAWIRDNTKIRNLTDFGDLPVFENVSAYPMIFNARKVNGGATQGFRFAKAESLDFPYPDVNALLLQEGRDILDTDLTKADWDIDGARGQYVTSGVEAKFITLGEMVGGHFLYGIKTGYNEAFIIDAEKRKSLLAADTAAGAFIKPLFVGRTIRKWVAAKAKDYLIYVPHGQKPPKVILRHLEQFKDRLEERATSQEWYELQQPQAKYAAQFARGKLIYPVMAKDARFCLNRDGSYINDKAYAIPSDDLFLLGVLNSKRFWSLVESTCSPLRGGFFELRATQISTIPIPIPRASDREAIVALVENCLKLAGNDLVDLERELDTRVETLYDRFAKGIN
jgi:hypothetical protein